MHDMYDETEQLQITEWLASGTTGESAKSIAAQLADREKQMGAYPRDEGDFGRCQRLLDMVPSLRRRMSLMAEVNAYWRALLPAWDVIAASGDQTALIRMIIEPIEARDPACHRKGDVSYRVGRVTFQDEGAQDDGADAAITGVIAADQEARRHKKGKPPMKPDPEFDEARSNTYRVTADELRSFIERYERLEAEKKDIADQQKEVMAEAKGRGYDVKVIRKVIALRKREPDDIAEEEAVLEMYLESLGMR